MGWRKVIYDFCTRSLLNFLIYEENYIFLFYQCAFLHKQKTLVFLISTLQKVSTKYRLEEFVRKSFASYSLVIYAHFLCFQFFNVAYHFQVCGLFSCWHCWATVASSLFSSSAEAKWTCQGKAGAGIFKQSMGTRYRVGILLSYRSATLHSLAELVPWNEFLGSFKSLKIRSQFNLKGK